MAVGEDNTPAVPDMSTMSHIRGLETVIAVLVRLVREEYPAAMSLVEIAKTYAGATTEEIAALQAYLTEGAETALDDETPTPEED